ncbi:hypothetical protein XM38_039760 [Halomicronema hongdechloris C2206]|uniref:Uncharacterized protein n=1 Tax=Halomicronema hongdechloris C2206 TaxID=1641165 RepID=A0A1Z3HRR4_9CYAN|nr:hypothetical protein [Halomicronema hongdechloris]ASC73014.1 hypothetical protein XM38_039760 [Halomicronema hongdechloris C2206]
MSQNLRSPASASPKLRPSSGFPAVSERLLEAFGLQPPLGLRPYGLAVEDLDIEFSQPLRPQLEIDVLAACTRDAQGSDIDPEFFWHLGVSQRTAALLKLVALEVGPTLTMTVTCPQESCQQTMEVAIALAALEQLQANASQDMTTVSLGQQQLRLRRPTGQDQLAWLTQASQGQPPAPETMVYALLVDPPAETELPPAWPDLDQALDQLDPLVNFSLAVTCPHCGQSAQPAIDLGAWALQALQRVQQRLIETVHHLACHYHWSEATILALPAWRRHRYLTLIDREPVY